MSAQPIGHRDMLVAKREGALARLSPMARHQAFPRVYAKPVPLPTDTDALRSQVGVLTRANDALRRANDTLRQMNESLKNQLDDAHRAPLYVAPPTRRFPASDVINAFLELLNATHSEGWTADHLKSPDRNRKYIMPRHVCIWLVRSLCGHYSLPQIGKMFGGRDHTTILHAMKRAPFWLEVDPKMKAVADAVLARFDETKGEQA